MEILRRARATFVSEAEAAIVVAKVLWDPILRSFIVRITRLCCRTNEAFSVFHINDL